MLAGLHTGSIASARTTEVDTCTIFNVYTPKTFQCIDALLGYVDPKVLIAKGHTREALDVVCSQKIEHAIINYGESANFLLPGITSSPDPRNLLPRDSEIS